MDLDTFLGSAKEMVAGYVNASVPQLLEALLGRELQAEDVKPEEIKHVEDIWTMEAGTALPDGRIYKVWYSCRTGAWSLTSYRREAAREESYAEN